MKVLIVSPGMYIYGGAELVIVRLANYLSGKGIENAILTTSMAGDIKKDLINTKIILSPLSKNLPFVTLKEIAALYKGIRKFAKEFDVINVHNYPSEIALFRNNGNTVWMCNEPPEAAWAGYKPSLLSSLIKKPLLAFDRFVVRRFVKKTVVSDEFNRTRFYRIYSVMPKIIHYGIDFEFFSQPLDNAGVKDKWQLHNAFIVLHVGMLTQYKNQLESIKAIEALQDRIPDIKLILAGFGDGGYEAELKNYVNKRGLKDKVIFTGHITRNDVRGLYQTADVLLHPIKSQGGWLAPFEALCSGKIVIVSRDMTAADLIAKDNIGIVTDDFTGAILDVYKDNSKYLRQAQAGKQWVKENLNWDRFCEKMVGVFEESVKAAKWHHVTKSPVNDGRRMTEDGR